MKAVFFKAVFFKGVCFKAVRMAFAGLLIGPGIAVPFVLAAIMFNPNVRSDMRRWRFRRLRDGCGHNTACRRPPEHGALPHRVFLLSCLSSGASGSLTGTIRCNEPAYRTKGKAAPVRHLSRFFPRARAFPCGTIVAEQTWRNKRGGTNMDCTEVDDSGRFRSSPVQANGQGVPCVGGCHRVAPYHAPARRTP